MGLRDPPELAEGLNLLDRYTIIDRIGGGGMADIYRAHDSRLDRIVCVKLLRNVIEGSGSTSGGVVYQATYTHFLREARALSKLAHPNTLRIYDFGFLQMEGDESGQISPRPFQISEFMDGGNLDTYVRTRGALPPASVTAILDRVAGAVAEAHGAGIIHRDIKPSNILFSLVGDVLMPKLADFGIARGVRRQARPGQTLSSEESSQEFHIVPLFSPRWAAPEQLASTEEGPFTDVYQLALVAAFMLAGHALFEVPQIDSTYPSRISGDAYVLSRLAMFPFAPEVARALMDGLRADPRSRIRSPFEMFEALSRAFGTPRASLPTQVEHSGGVPSIRPETPGREVVSVKASFASAAPGTITPPEQWLEVAGRKVRVVSTSERLDVSVPTPGGIDLRLRVTLLPAQGASFKVNVKGLNCFIGRPGASPSPALVTDADGAADLVSPRKERLGGLVWSFGALRGSARVFPVAQGEVVIPFPHGQHALAIVIEGLAPDREVIVICRSA